MGSNDSFSEGESDLVLDYVCLVRFLKDSLGNEKLVLDIDKVL